MRYKNVYALFRERVAQMRDRPAFWERGPTGWTSIGWAEWERDAHRFAWALLAEGLTPGAAVCILAGNAPVWPMSDVGTIIAGGVSVGIYPTSSAEQCRYIIGHSDAEFVVVDTVAQAEKIMRVRHELPKLKGLVAVDEEAARRFDLVAYREFLRQGEAARARVEAEQRRRASEAHADETAIIVYTSGTTGLPKGACLSHRYIINSVESLRATVPIYDWDVTFSYLPYCHVAERISGLYNRLYAGTAAHFVTDVSKLDDYMTEVRPTVFASLPRFFEKIYARIQSDLARDTEHERAAFHEALKLGHQVASLRRARQQIPIELQREYERRARPVLARVHDYFGGRLRLATSGGAPLPVEIGEFFDACGITILQAYGLTENVCVAFNRPDHYKFDAVGPPMPGCEVRIAEDGEIMVRSQMMFSGYYKEPERTAEVVRDGWLLTGDLGELDADGFLRITGRKKELIVTSTGKKIAPSFIENLLKSDPLISQAFVYGEGRSYLVALLTLNRAEAERWARSSGVAFKDFAELITRPEIEAMVRRAVEQVNARVSSTEQIKRFLVLDRDFEIERDELTPTLKLRRETIARHFADRLKQIYGE